LSLRGFTTIIVDIIAIPTVFRNISKIEEAGKIGMTIFGLFNYLEIFFALIVLSASLIYFKKNQVKRFLIFAIPLFILSLCYTFIFTPAITNTTYLIQQTLTTDPLFAELQTKHAFYHQLYRTLDTIKLTTLLIFTLVILVHEVKEQG